jgi:acyl-CoA reductase-like NAD-dependent aldehyde dehydrogenase
MTTATLTRRARPQVAPATHFINGEFVDSLSGETLDVIDPATEETTTTTARGRSEDVDRAVRAARDAFASGVWSRATPGHRRQVLMRIADLIEQRGEEIHHRESLEMGRPVGQPGSPMALGMISRSAWNFRFFAMEQELAGDDAFNRDDTLLTYTVTDPAGVFGLITPWNGPFMLSTWKIGPCLAFGNSAVHKPSEWSPLSIQVLAEIMSEAGLPPWVFNIVNGLGPEAGAALVQHPDVTGVSFTGSPGTARDISGRAAATLKRVSCELGGKSANIIFADANLEHAVPAAAGLIFGNSGQSCTAGSRILVQRPIYERFLDALRAEAEKWTPGDPFDPATRLGPLVSRRQHERVTGYLELARQEGRIFHGGGRPAGLERGFFVEPTIIVDAPNAARVCQEEIFGPVAVVLPFEDADGALAIANDSTYGLAGYIWTESQTTAHYTALRLQAGMIWINSGFNRDLRQPFGGLKQSGVGREGGGYSREFYTEKRFIAFPLAPR